ncbi:pyruvate formate-lyase-activating protein [Paraburkholderia dinghuensis]|uniref:Pyruvate formate-lyase-activating enzyme n=1 Tax=Paraburkholderia dinghuensis TaxID=2305225 RepID=A0A3N6MW48_9BURK|nr:pyruvate formate-lyase-activating protein [Paraburkholderia dinghuensis]RQH00592.1 pyruvate formate lyase-activating protein [Paraburkholderia dinghuensis]
MQAPRRVLAKAAVPRGLLHSVDTGAAADGPGVRFVYFFSGCPLRCQYCHNPDTWRFSSGREITVDEAVEEIRPYARFLRFTGGVTVSGGEPLAQRAFVGELLKRLRNELNLHTALDTQGYLGGTVSDTWLDAVDLVLLDIKHIDPAHYRKLTRVDLAPTLAFARRLAHLNKSVWIRYVLVPGLTDDPVHIAQLGDFLRELGPIVKRVDVLPFHQLGAHKWKSLDLDYKLAYVKPPSAAKVAEAVQILRERGLPAE